MYILKAMQVYACVLDLERQFLKWLFSQQSLSIYINNILWMQLNIQGGGGCCIFVIHFAGITDLLAVNDTF